MNETQKIKAAIEAQGLKVKFLALKIGVVPSTLSSFLSGKRSLGLAAKKSLLRELGLGVDSFGKGTTSKSAS